MTQDTQSKMAAILLAAQAKANIQTTVNFAPKAPEQAPKEFDNLQDIEQAAKNGEVISLLNLANLVKKDKPVFKPEVKDIFPELSTVTSADLLNDTQEPITGQYSTVDYSDRSFAIVTKEKPNEDILNIFRLHGTFNSHLKCGKGWIFSKRHLAAIKEKLSL